MAFHLPNGATVFVGSKISEKIPFSAITNAVNAVITVEADTVNEGDIVLISSGWSHLSNVVAKVTSVESTKATLGGINTSNTKIFIPGSGVGSIQVIDPTSWVQIPQITEVSASGGEQNYYQFQFLEDDQQRSLPTFKSARTQSYTIAHDNQQPFYEVLKAADLAGDTLPMYMYVPKAKETRYWSATPSFNGEPNPVVNQIETVTASFAVQSKGTSFYSDVAEAA